MIFLQKTQSGKFNTKIVKVYFHEWCFYQSKEYFKDTLGANF